MHEPISKMLTEVPQPVFYAGCSITEPGVKNF